jgi:hypothetical protein
VPSRDTRRKIPAIVTDVTVSAAAPIGEEIPAADARVAPRVVKRNIDGLKACNQRGKVSQGHVARCSLQRGKGENEWDARRKREGPKACVGFGMIRGRRRTRFRKTPRQMVGVLERAIQHSNQRIRQARISYSCVTVSNSMTCTFSLLGTTANHNLTVNIQKCKRRSGRRLGPRLPCD